MGRGLHSLPGFCNGVFSLQFFQGATLTKLEPRTLEKSEYVLVASRFNPLQHITIYCNTTSKTMLTNMFWLLRSGCYFLSPRNLSCACFSKLQQRPLQAKSTEWQTNCLNLQVKLHPAASCARAVFGLPIASCAGPWLPAASCVWVSKHAVSACCTSGLFFCLSAFLVLWSNMPEKQELVSSLPLDLFFFFFASAVGLKTTAGFLDLESQCDLNRHRNSHDYQYSNRFRPQFGPRLYWCVKNQSANRCCCSSGSRSRGRGSRSPMSSSLASSVCRPYHTSNEIRASG